MGGESESYYSGVNHKIFGLVSPNAKRILDVGCARGLLGEAIKKQAPGREVWGIELVPEVASEAKTRLDHVLVGDIEKMDPLPLPEAYFDCVIFGDVLEHLREPEELLRRLKVYFQPEGQLIVCVPNIGHWSVVLQLLQGKFDYQDKGLLDRTHMRFFTPQSLSQTLWDAGYMVVQEDPNELPSPMSTALANVAAQMGADGELSLASLETYQQVYACKLRPDPFKDPEKIGILLGPHVGCLGKALKRCSIIIVTFNSGGSIQACLDGVLASIGPEDEVIVVDNDSQDATVERLQTCQVDSRVRLVANAENRFYSRAANQGILESRGEFIVLLNPDTLVWPGWLEKMSVAFEEARVGAVGPVSDSTAGQQFIGLHVPDWRNDWEPEVSLQRVAAMPDALYETRMLMGFCLMQHRPILDQVGLLDETTFMGADDLELAWRYQELGYTLNVCGSVFVHHEGRGSFSSVDPKVQTDHIRVSDQALVAKLREYFGSKPNSRHIWGSAIFTEALAANW